MSSDGSLPGRQARHVDGCGLTPRWQPPRCDVGGSATSSCCCSVLSGKAGQAVPTESHCGSRGPMSTRDWWSAIARRSNVSSRGTPISSGTAAASGALSGPVRCPVCQDWAARPAPRPGGGQGPVFSLCRAESVCRAGQWTGCWRDSGT